MARQLTAILDYVDQLQRTEHRRRRAAGPPAAGPERLPPRRAGARRCRWTRRCANAPDRVAATSSASRPSSTRRTDQITETSFEPTSRDFAHACDRLTSSNAPRPNCSPSRPRARPRPRRSPTPSSPPSATREPKVKAFLHVDEAGVRAAGPRPSTRSARPGEPLGPLAGVPVAIKDVLCTEGEPTTCGSRMLAELPSRPTTPHVDRAAARRPTRSSSARRTWTSSRWARPPRTAPTGHAATRGTRPHPRRLVGRLGGGGRRRARPRCRSGTDTGGSIRQPAGALRHRRPEADLRPGQPLRPDRLRQLARPGRPVRPRRGRRGPAAGGHRRPRPARRAPASTGRCPTTRRRSTTPLEAAARSAWPASSSARGSTPRSRRPSARRSEGLRDARGDGQGGLAAAQPSTASRPTTSSPRPRLEQPGPLRRRALRPPGDERSKADLIDM